jgi:hypothetical protein
MTLWEYMKLSWMHLFFMKAFCAPDTSSFIHSASRFARILVIIFATLLIRLIGL